MLTIFLFLGLAMGRPTIPKRSPIEMSNYKVTPGLYEMMKSDLTKLMQQFNTTDPKQNNEFKYVVMPTVVRFGFHSCVGGCDGCINLNDPNNYGLQRAISPLETTYAYYKNNVTRADFWSFAMIAASEFACKTKGGSMYTPKVVPEYGRVDCPTAPQTCKLYEYPNGNMDTAEVLDYYFRTMNLSPQEVTALLGAHTLGGGHRKDSGYFNDWDDEVNKLDNGYYTDLMTPVFGWKMATCQTPLYRKNQYQWVHSDGSKFMLDVDMALYKNITPVAPNGYVKCTWSECPLSETAKYVKMYSLNNTKFLDDYAAVVTKMLRVGQGPLQPVYSN